MTNSGALERDHTNQGSKIPGRVINLDRARARHGDKADYMVQMLSAGDPLADAVIVEMDALGREGRRILNAGIADGLKDLTERPPAIAALLQQLETMPAWVDPDMLGRGESRRCQYRRCGMNCARSAAPWCTPTPRPPSPVTDPNRSADHRGAPAIGRNRHVGRAGHDARWATARSARIPCHRPGTAAARKDYDPAPLKHGWDTTEWGVPISQVDVARTWLDFTLTPFRALAVLGIKLTETEATQPVPVLALHCLSAGSGGQLLPGRHRSRQRPGAGTPA